MRKLLKRLENETVCVFLNSTETILSLIYASDCKAEAGLLQ